MPGSATLMLCAIFMFLTGSVCSRLGGIAYGLVLGAAVMTRPDTLTFALVMLAGGGLFLSRVWLGFRRHLLRHRARTAGLRFLDLLRRRACDRDQRHGDTSAIQLHPTTFLDTVAPTPFDAPLLYAKRLIESAVSGARRSAVAIAVSPGLVLLLLYLLRGRNRLALLRQSVQHKDLLVIAATCIDVRAAVAALV